MSSCAPVRTIGSFVGKLDIRKLNRMAETGEYELPDAESQKLVEGLIEGKNSADA